MTHLARRWATIKKDQERSMSIENVQCGKRTYTIECRITKNGHKYLMITEKSFGRLSKVMVFHDHYQLFREAMDRVSQAEPLPASAQPVLA
jgi:hypothetical protein